MPNESEQSRIERNELLNAFQDELGGLIRRHKKHDNQTELIMRFKGSVTVNARELSVFLDLFTIAYNASLVIFHYARESADPLVITEEIVHQALTEISGLEDKGQFVELEMERISFQTRLEITFIGATTPLTLAVVLSGGEVEVEPLAIKAAMPSLGKVSKSLRCVFND